MGNKPVTKRFGRFVEQVSKRQGLAMKRGLSGRHEVVSVAGERVRAFVPNPLPPEPPLLYLSLYFKKPRAEYYRLLDPVRREGDWEAWVDFFLEGGKETAENAVETPRRLVALFQRDERKIQALGRGASTALRVFYALRTLGQVCEHSGLSFPAVSKGMAALKHLGIVHEIPRRHRNRLFAYPQYLNILNEGTEALKPQKHAYGK